MVGRNIALKQSTTQSTTHGKYGKSDLAVDGNTDADYEKQSCSHTDTEDKTLEWNLLLSSSYTITRILLYNRNEECK